MSRITQKVSINEVAANTVAEETAESREEQSAAQEEQSSFYASAVVEGSGNRTAEQEARRGLLSRPSLTMGLIRPAARLTERQLEMKQALRGLHSLPTLEAIPDETLLTRSHHYQMLASLPMKELRRSYGYVHAHHKGVQLDKDLGMAFVSKVSKNIYEAADTLRQLATEAQKLNRGVGSAEAFFAAWDKEGFNLRQASNDQLSMLREGLLLTGREKSFYEQLLAALDEFSLPVAIAKSKNLVPSPQTLQHLVTRLQDVANLDQHLLDPK